MLRIEPFIALDQTTDPKALLYAETERLYDTYQQREYDENYVLRRDAWERHYSRMRTATELFLWRFCERHQKKRSEMKIAIVGPGFDPASRDYDQRLIDVCLSQLQTVILVDFSNETNNRARQSLVRAGVDGRRMHSMQYDVTGGLSTAYMKFLSERLAKVGDTEEDLANFAEVIAKLDIVSILRQRIFQEIVDLETSLRMGKIVGRHRTLIAAALAAQHHFRFTAQGDHVPVDIFSLNMMLAGTGAAAEDVFWEKYKAVTATTDTERGGHLLEQDLAMRRGILRNIHLVITRFNNEVAHLLIEHILTHNQDARILAMTDVSTNYKDEDLNAGRLPRLNIQELSDVLRREGGYELTQHTPVGTWPWHDEDYHYHDVVSFTVQVGQSTVRRRTPESLPIISQDSLPGTDASTQ